jgi:asparagine synthetase B (glutamine-hydrolysing)
VICSDGVGYGWIDGLKDYAESQVTDEELASAAEKFPYNSPDTKEAYLFRKIFESLFHVLLSLTLSRLQTRSLCLTLASSSQWAG